MRRVRRRTVALGLCWGGVLYLIEISLLSDVGGRFVYLCGVVIGIDIVLFFYIFLYSFPPLFFPLLVLELVVRGHACIWNQWSFGVPRMYRLLKPSDILWRWD